MVNTAIQGLSICEGLAFGPIKKIIPEAPQISETLCIDIHAEVARFQQALKNAQKQIQNLLEEKKSLLGKEELQIFEAHLLFLEDPEYIDQIVDKIKTHQWSATKSVRETSNEFAQMLAALPDPYLAARSQDIQDIAQRLIKNITHPHDTSTATLSSFKGILALKEIHPSLVAELNPQQIQGVLTEQGGATSHSAILLKNLEIPTIFGIPNLLSFIQDNDIVLMDARKGFLTCNPSLQDQTWFQDQQKKFEQEKELLNSFKFITASTQDGLRVNLSANIGTVADLKTIEKMNPDGIGLFRTEFLFLDRTTAPSEEEQYLAYTQTLQAMKGKKTIIRTLDIGGDKVIPYLNLAQEENPFLGLRGLRLCLANQNLFRTQLRALLKASVHGELSIMYPMVTQLSEWMQAQAIVQEEKAALEKQGHYISSSIRFGIMIEVPAAALMIDAFAPNVDFFSIGTNDLIQYTCACDRMNPSVSYLYSHFEPSVLKLIHQIIHAAKKHQKDLSICGEMGGDLNLVPFLIGAGLTALSMTSQQIPKVKQLLQTLTMAHCQQLTEAVLKASTALEIKTLLSNREFRS